MGRARHRGESRERSSARNFPAFERGTHMADVEPVGEAPRQAGGGRSTRRPARCRRGRGGSGRSARSVSSSSQAARGSPSRGWPTLPGLISQLAGAEVEQGAVARLGAADLIALLLAVGRAKKSATCEWPIRAIRSACASRQASACSAESTYSQTGSRGEAWKRPMPSRSPAGSSSRRNSSVRSATFSRVQSTASAAASEKAAMSSAPSTARSWLPTRQTSQRSRTRSAQASGSAP